MEGRDDEKRRKIDRIVEKKYRDIGGREESERERMVENVVTNPSVEIKEGKKDFGRVGHGWRHGKSKQPPRIGG